MAWIVEFTQEAEKDLHGLDHSQQLQVLKAIQKVSLNPLPNTEGGYGKPLGSHISVNLTGFLKIKLQKLGIRVVYCLVTENSLMKIIIISVRDDEIVYRMARERIARKR
jgi:mRNA interferase RelE/StbE